MYKWIAVFALVLLLSACSTNANQNTGQNQSTDTAKPTPTSNDKVKDDGHVQAKTPKDAADAVILALKDADMAKLSSYVHPDKGLLFSPYAHIDTATAKVFPAGKLPALTDATLYQWGAYDGSGEPIKLTFKQYYDKFVYDKNFAEPEAVGVDQIKGTGNTVVNIKEVFPNSYIMDYYFSGFDPQYEGMDWESLTLVLEELNGAWYVSAIVHSQWTI
ncbi:hypothetical protein [Bacillus sp. FJAT-26390]|uniref:hypothetical protein n=1 Tax=Bacillus sp. FJAT-26390 TaxID=1743142 RepID=UPI000807A2B9|nr:hypothetical protein [Bacillus sp. FJAT-26390]OBZ08566.1 hypothetical protein A7975_26130 [Bacillus sp. FJAT-26390]